MRKIGFLLTATNAYLPLGIRFVKQFRKHYVGQDRVLFHMIADDDPHKYTQDRDIIWTYRKHTDWARATESRFEEFLKLDAEDLDYVFWIDADTCVTKPTDLSWLIGDLVVCEHFGNKTWLGEQKNYDRNPKCNAYVSLTDPRPKTYYMGMLWGGKHGLAMHVARHIVRWVKDDHYRGQYAAVQDESYINKYFLDNPPAKVVPWEEFPFVVSDKGGIPETRDVNFDTTEMKAEMVRLRDKQINIHLGKVIEA